MTGEYLSGTVCTTKRHSWCLNVFSNKEAFLNNKEVVRDVSTYCSQNRNSWCVDELPRKDVFVMCHHTVQNKGGIRDVSTHYPKMHLRRVKVMSDEQSFVACQHTVKQGRDIHDVTTHWSAKTDSSCVNAMPNEDAPVMCQCTAPGENNHVTVLNEEPAFMLQLQRNKHCAWLTMSFLCGVPSQTQTTACSRFPGCL
jgi:hypothetical protein